MSTANNSPDDAKQCETFADHVRDAGILLNHAVVTGVDVDAGILDAIYEATRYVETGNLNLNDEAVIVRNFDEARRDLAVKMNPVTAHTLRATNPDCGRIFPPLWFKVRRSEAEIWSLKMWLFTGFALLMIGWTEFMQEILYDWFPLSPDNESSVLLGLHLGLVGLNILLPFIYGLLGACLYLLPKCHEFVADRSFDPLRIAEYKSRLLLGFASGGIVMFFVHEIGVGEGDEIIQLSAPVLAIIAGYNTDFIFQAIERMVAAIIPKVGPATAKRAEPPPTTKVRPVSIEALVEALAKADGEDKITIRAAIDAATKRF